MFTHASLSTAWGLSSKFLFFQATKKNLRSQEKKDESVESEEISLQNEENVRAKFKLENQFAEGSRIGQVRKNIKN